MNANGRESVDSLVFYSRSFASIRGWFGSSSSRKSKKVSGTDLRKVFFLRFSRFSQKFLNETAGFSDGFANSKKLPRNATHIVNVETKSHKFLFQEKLWFIHNSFFFIK
jgi:hypothetical protein